MSEADDAATWARMMIDSFGLDASIEKLTADAELMSASERYEMQAVFERLAFIEAMGG